MQGFIVAVEYRGPTLRPGAGSLRVPVCEHAYDLEAGALAGHPAGQQPRVGFPAGQRGWNSQPRTARCPDCDTLVLRTVRDLIAATLSALTGRWSFQPGQVPPDPEPPR
jgi:rubredoxin